MTHNFCRFFLILFSSFILLACHQEKLTYHYLMTHPNALQQAAKHCQTTANQAETCQVVMSAANSFTRLLMEQQQAPEKFGDRILSAQNACVMMKQASSAANTNANAISPCEEVKIFLAVVSLSRPE